MVEGINEIPMDVRTSEVIVCALWVGKDKPDMNVFLQTFLANMNQISDLGISCTIQGEVRLAKPYTICCVDSAAWAPMQVITQCNTFFGCSWCLHQGEWAQNAESTGGCIIYIFLLFLSLKSEMNKTC